MAEQVQQLTPEMLKEAQAFLATNVFLPTFFEKLASFGRRPANEAEADTYARLAYQALSGRQQQHQARAQEQSSILKRAAARAGIAVNDPGTGNDEAWIKGAAAQYTQYPEIQQAIAVLQTGLLAGHAA